MYDAKQRFHFNYLMGNGHNVPYFGVQVGYMPQITCLAMAGFQTLSYLYPALRTSPLEPSHRVQHLWVIYGAINQRLLAFLNIWNLGAELHPLPITGLALMLGHTWS